MVKSRWLGYILALSALLVNAPRLVLTYLRTDNIHLPLMTEASLLTITGIATGIVLTGGGMYLAHTLAQARRHWFTRLLLTLCWLALLGFTVILLAPMMLSGLRASDLIAVIPDTSAQWTWSITAVLAIEVMAGGIMLAIGTTDLARPRPSSNSNFAERLLDAVVRRIEPAPVPASKPEPVPAPNPKPEPDLWLSYPCPACQRTFTTNQALNAHKRFCTNHRTEAYK